MRLTGAAPLRCAAPFLILLLPVARLSLSGLLVGPAGEH